MSINVSDIPEVPSWVALSGDGSDNWFYQQLATFAGQRLSSVANIAVSGECPLATTPVPITVNAEPKAYICICPANIGAGGGFFRIIGEDVGFILQYTSAGPTYQLSIITAAASLIGAQTTNNGDGTWTVSMVNNSTTDPDFYTIFLQT